MLLLGPQGPRSAGCTAGALSHDTSLPVSKLCTYARPAELFRHRRLTVSPCTSKAFIPTPQSPIPPFLFFSFCLNRSRSCGKEGNRCCLLGASSFVSLCEKRIYCTVKSLPFADRVFSQPVFIPVFVFYVYTHSSPAYKGYNLFFIKAIDYSETENNILGLKFWVSKECAGRTDAAFGKDGVKIPS